MFLNLAYFLDASLNTNSPMSSLIWYRTSSSALFLLNWYWLWWCNLIQTLLDLRLWLRWEQLWWNVSSTWHANLVVHDRLGQWEHLSEFGRGPAEAIEGDYGDLIARAIQTWMTHASGGLRFVQLILLFIVLWQSWMMQELLCDWDAFARRCSVCLPTLNCWCMVTRNDVSVRYFFDFRTVTFSLGLLWFQIEVLDRLTVTFDASMMH